MLDIRYGLLKRTSRDLAQLNVRVGHRMSSTGTINGVGRMNLVNENECNWQPMATSDLDRIRMEFVHESVGVL